MKILVTGAAGFIASHLVDYLLRRQYDVYGLDNLSGGFMENVNKKCIPSKFCDVDLQDYEKALNAVLDINPQIIFHLAADATKGRSQFIPVSCTRRNYVATLNLLVAGMKSAINRFVFASSMAVYGNQKPPFDEAMKPRPEDTYGISKAASEKAIGLHCTMVFKKCENGQSRKDHKNQSMWKWK